MKRHNTLLGILALAAGAGAPANADTLYLKDGVQLDGIVREVNETMFSLTVGENTVFYRRDEVERLEENDRTGLFDAEALEAEWELQKQAVESELGLTLEQRDRVDTYLARMKNEDADRVEARRSLVSMQQECNVYAYLETLLGGINPPHIPIILETMFHIDPLAARGPIRAHLEYPFWSVRREAVELLATMNDQESLPLLVRGLADQSTEVVIETANALGRMRARSASSALVALLTHPDQRVTNTCRDALAALWDAELNDRRPRTVDEWNAFLEAHPVESPFKLASLEPLSDEPQIVIE